MGQATNELYRDGVIQRFEFTFELFWKTIKTFLEYEGFSCMGPRSCIKEGARRGFLKNGEVLIYMLEDRNKISQIYDESSAKEIFERIKKEYLSVIEENIRLFDNYFQINSKLSSERRRG